MNADEQPVSFGGVPSAAALPGGHRIGSFELQSVALRGSGGLVYHAWDHALARPVAIKEYLPAALALRNANGEVHPGGADCAAEFERGRCDFIDEARTLARCDHPSLVRVLDLVEAGGTAYRVMPWYSGRLLLDVRRKMKGPVGEPALRTLLDNLLGALEAYQRVGGVHRGVSPSQVLLLDEDRAMLLGPGAASRAARTGSVEALAPTSEAGFAPPEQAHPSDGQPQGPWTDFHALAAVARFCITGMVPPAAGLDVAEPLAATVERMFVHQPSVRYGADLLHALDAALSPDIAKRPRTAAQFRETLLGAPHRQAAVPAAPSVHVVDAATVDLIRRVIDSIDEPDEPVLGPDPDAMPPLHADPADRDGLNIQRKVPPRHRALWAGMALTAVTAVSFGALQLQGQPFRLPGAPPAAALPVPVTQALAFAAPPPLPIAALPERAAPVGPASPAPAAPVVRVNAVALLVAGPRQECGARTEFSLYRCIQQQCGLAKWQRHPQCVQLQASGSID